MLRLLLLFVGLLGMNILFLVSDFSFLETGDHNRKNRLGLVGGLGRVGGGLRRFARFWGARREKGAFEARDRRGAHFRLLLARCSL